MNLNKVMIIGNLTRDPEIKTTPTGQTVASFAVATNRVWTDAQGQKQEKAEFHNVVAWRRLAEICGQYLHKGSKIYIEGRMQTRDWVGQDGIKKYWTEIVTENMIMLDGKGSGGNAAPAPAMPTEQPAAPEEPTISVEEPVGGNAAPAEEDIKVENIPF